MNCNRTIAPPNFPVAATVEDPLRRKPSTRSAVRVPSQRRGVSLYAPGFVSARFSPSHSSVSQISNFKSEIAGSLRVNWVRSLAHSSASLRESLRLCVILFPVAPRTPSCNTQLQLAAFPRSVDSRALKSNLSPFRINTSKNFCNLCISLISGRLKSSVINTSEKNHPKPSKINTSKKHGRGEGNRILSTCADTRLRPPTVETI
jgi:hypothetical protein